MSSKREEEKRRRALRAQHLGREFTRYLLDYYGARGRSIHDAGRSFAAAPMTSAEAEWATRELMIRKDTGFLGDSGDREEARDMVLDRRRSGGHAPNEDLTWREVYARAYKAAAADGLEDWRARETASRAAWSDYEARTGRSAQSPNPPLWESDDEAEYMRLLDRYDEEMAEAGRLEDEGYVEQARIHRRAAEAAERAADRISRRYAANAPGYYVWALARGSNEPLSEGPWGPYETLESAKTFARIGATEGAHDRAVSLGFDPESSGFRIVRRYQARTGERLL